jgi:uncharacterized protein (DUF58 family)
MKAHRKRWLAVAILILVPVVVVLSNSTVLVGSDPRMESYQVADEHTIVVTVAVAPRSWTRVTSVAETGTEVRVRVESFVWPIPLAGASYLELRTLTVPLTISLLRRAVQDAAGNAIPLR